jgi:hypothetical protein
MWRRAAIWLLQRLLARPHVEKSAKPVTAPLQPAN